MASMAEYVPYMNNRELNHLAQNRFTDEETQVAIAKHPYARCRMHLAYNSKICDEAVDVLMKGKSNIAKWALVEQGRLNDTPERIAKVYNDTPTRYRSSWRMSTTFGDKSWGTFKSPNTPPDVLMSIYKDFMTNEREGYYYVKGIAQHPNAPEDMAIMMSTSNRIDIQKAGFARLIEINKEKKLAKRNS